MAVFISNQSGLWSSASTWLTAASGTLSPTAPAGNAPQSGGGDKFIIRGGHIVEYDVSGEFGDGGNVYTTSLTVLTGNAIILSGGELKCSRTTNNALTANGTLVVAPSGYFNWGTSTDPITAINSTITLGKALTGRGCIYLYTANSATVPVNNKFYVYGKEKTTNTYLTVSGLSGSSVITVNDTNGWNVGDRLVIETESVANISTRTLVTSITSISGNNVGISPTLNESKSTFKKVGNFTKNITFNSLSAGASTSSSGIFGSILNTKSEFQMYNASLNEIGQSQWTNTGATQNTFGAISLDVRFYNNDPINIKNISYYSTNSPSFLYHTGAYPEFLNVDNIAASQSTGGNTYLFNLNTLCNTKIDNLVAYRAGYLCILNTAFPNKSNFNNIYGNFVGGIFGITTNGLVCSINNSTLRSASRVLFYDGIQNLSFNNCNIQYATTLGIASPNNNAAGIINFKNCNIIQPSGPISRDPTGPNSTTKTNYDSEINVLSLSGNVLDNRRFNYYYYSQSDLTNRKNGINSWRFKPEYPNVLLKSIDEIPATAGETQKIKGNIQFDTNYGVSYPPSISFVGAGVNQTFTCGPTANIWQTFELDLNPTETGDITITLSGQSSSTSGYIWLDGLNIDPFVKQVRWYGYEFDSNVYRTINTLNTLSENQVSALNSVSNLDELYDSAMYWSVTNPGLTSYIDLVTNNGTLLDFGNRNIILNNTGTVFDYNSASNTIILNSPILSAGTNFNTIKTTGTVTLSTGVIQNLDINSNIVQTVPTNLTGIYMLSASNTLTYNTNTPIEVEYTNCTMVGVKNDGNAIVTIKRTNSTVVESDAEITTYSPTLVNLNLQGGYISIYDNLSTRQYYTNTDSTLVLGSSATGTWSYRIARYGFNYLLGSFTVDPNVGETVNIAPNYVTDPFVVAPLSSVQNYTDLNSTEKIHDYMSFFMTTSTGIEYGDLVDYSIGVLQFKYPLTLDGTATSLVTFSAGIITLKSSSLNESFTLLIDGDFNQLNGNTISDGIKIRSNNLDSEFLFRNINSITFYPTETDRDNNTNAGLTTTATIYRFKYGVVYSNYVYNRITADGIVFLKTTAITTGENIIDLGTTASIQTILGNQKIMNTGIQKASILVPHTTNI